MADFTSLETEIEIVGPARISIEELRQRLRWRRTRMRIDKDTRWDARPVDGQRCQRCIHGREL